MEKGAVKNFFVKIKPSRRRIIQVYAALLFNCNLQGFVTGKIFEGATKSVCVPGMNCYSCPGAIGACPLGSLQNALAGAKTKTVTYVLGIILLYAIMFGRAICGYLCPAGLAQELLYKIRTPKLKKSKVTYVLSYLKYVILAVMVVGIPLIFGLTASSTPIPAFCKYICPVGTAEGAIGLLSNPNNYDFFGMLGELFTWKFGVLCLFLVSSVFVYRVFCRFFCPLGALYGLFNKIAVLGIHVDETKCNHCGACVANCKMDVKTVGDHECILCGECRESCSQKAISYRAQDMIEYFKAKKADELKEEKAVEKKPVVIEASESPKKKIKAKKVITWSIVVTCAVVLTGASCYAALSQNKTRFALNDICNDFSYVDVKGNRYDISTDSSAKIVYFFSNQEDQYLEKLNGYASAYEGKLTVTAVSNYALKDTLPSFVESHYPSSLIRFTSDTLNGDLINRFSTAKEEKYSLAFAKNNKVVLSNVGPISDQDFNDVVLPAISGAKIGNEVGDLCLSQDVKLINGEEGYWSVNANRGKVSIINFWGTWCGPCLDELPSFREVYEEHKEEGLEFIAIHQKGYSEEEVNSFIKSDPRLNVFTSHFGLDDENNEYYAALGGKAAWPMTLIVGKDGIISAKHQGEISKETLESEVVAALNK